MVSWLNWKTSYLKLDKDYVQENLIIDKMEDKSILLIKYVLFVDKLGENVE